MMLSCIPFNIVKVPSPRIIEEVQADSSLLQHFVGNAYADITAEVPQEEAALYKDLAMKHRRIMWHLLYVHMKTVKNAKPREKLQRVSHAPKPVMIVIASWHIP